ncbi:MAG: alpha/beta hydrolase, partial [Planctomycetia bacterium]|nr:alpha/beta hydrolase [Planctomycetia bacterium]
WRSIGADLKEPQDLENIPALVIYGEEDYLMDKNVRDKFVEVYGDKVEYICHEGMGHNLHWEDPALIAGEVKDFFNATEPADIDEPAAYDVGEKGLPPVEATGAEPGDYYNKKGRLIKQLDSIPQGDWVDFKHYVELESGITMAYIEMGNPDGEDLLLLHGMTDSSRSWSLLTSYLAEDYHLYIPDQRGHGDTDKPDMKKYDRSVFSWDIACFMEEMGLEKANVMGHSMGSFNAQALAMDYPELVDKLILESTNMIGVNSENPEDSYNIYDPNSPTYEGVTWDYIEWWYYNTNPVPEVFHQFAMTECYSYPMDTWQVQFPVDYQARLLKNAGIEVLVLYGGVDYLFPVDTQDNVKKEMTEAGVDYQHITYKNRGHNLHWEEPEQVASDVKDFLNGTLDPSVIGHEYEPFNSSPPTGSGLLSDLDWVA